MSPLAPDLSATATPCPCCGTYSGTAPGTVPALLAVCDVLVVRALEVVGKRLVRVERSRYQRLGTRPWHEAHTLWRPEEASVMKTLRGSWDVVPALLDNHGVAGVSARQVEEVLDLYVRDLLITGTAHRIESLRYRFEAFLGVPLPEIEPYAPRP